MMGMGGGPFGGAPFGGGMVAGDFGGGGGGKGGGKVNLSGAIAMIPKPIALTPPQITPIRPQPPMQPDDSGGSGLAQLFTQFSQG